MTGRDMPTLDRRQFLKLAAALGATLATGCAHVGRSTSGWRERRALYPQGVASGDPEPEGYRPKPMGVLIWLTKLFASKMRGLNVLFPPPISMPRLMAARSCNCSGKYGAA